MVIPVHDENPLRRTPWVTWLLVAVNVVVLVLTPLAGVTATGVSGTAQLCRQEAFLDRYAAIPHELVKDRQLPVVSTGQPGPAPGTCAAGRPTFRTYPPLSVLWSMFIHAGWLHLLGNMLFLVIFGNNVEDKFRRIPYLLFYLASGYVAAYGFAFTHHSSLEPLVGASGAIAGVLGAYLAIFPRAQVWSLLVFIPLRIPAWLVLGSWFILQGVYSAGYGTSGAGAVAYAAHVFGFVFGFLVGLIVRAFSGPTEYGVYPRWRTRLWRTTTREHAAAAQGRATCDPRARRTPGGYVGSVTGRTYADNRPYLLPETLKELVGPLRGAVRLPSRLDWSEHAEFHLDNPAERNVMYERVIREATQVDDLRTYLNGVVLREVWRSLYLPIQARRSWEERFPDLRLAA